MPITDILAEKKRLRAHYLALRAAIPAAQKAVLDAAICRAVAGHPLFSSCDVLLCFSPVRDEPNFNALFELARKRGVKTAFPRCIGTRMDFHVVENETELEPGRFGIPTPPAHAPLAAFSTRSLCLVPALSVAPDGTRLGYGGGFYDRFLESFPGVTIAPIYDDLVCNALPREQTDLPVSLIITEKGELLPHG